MPLGGQALEEPMAVAGMLVELRRLPIGRQGLGKGTGDRSFSPRAKRTSGFLVRMLPPSATSITEKNPLTKKEGNARFVLHFVIGLLWNVEPHGLHERPVRFYY